MIKIFCDKCGLCCKLFGHLDLPPEYQFMADEMGRCRYLQGNLCSIYPERPPLCSSEWMYKHVYQKQYTWAEYEAFLRRQCADSKEKYGDVLLDEK